MNDKTTFWNFLKDNIVEIPIIQRDYAQGRKGKAFIRQTFLSNLKQALEDNSKELVLDFVYGSSKGKKFYPLDGQQRLTTLWLLHWYVALRAGCLEMASVLLNNFTYETRISSREFCQQLCRSELFENYDGLEGINEFIRKQTWFYSTWEQDPTIQSMLRMLSGEKTQLFEFDGIEPIFANKTVEDFAKYWKSLTEGACIVFYNVHLDNFGLSDDLYIKMNARGKQLTPFENFKADLVGYINEQKGKDWERFQNPQSGIAILLDTEWTNLFWKNHSENYSIDEIYLTFLNRFFWEELFMTKLSKVDGKETDESEKYLLRIGRITDNGETINNVEAKNQSYIHLNADDYMNYWGIEPYLYERGKIPAQFFERLEILLSNFKNYIKENNLTLFQFSCNVNFSFIPKYEKGPQDEIKVSSINQIQRVVFFALCKYFIEGKGSVKTLSPWMRIVWNMVSCTDEEGRSSIRSTAAIRSVMELLSGLDSHNVYHSLCRQEVNAGKVGVIEKKWNEEIVKAKQIIDGDGKLRKYQQVLRMMEVCIIHGRK